MPFVIQTKKDGCLLYFAGNAWAIVLANARFFDKTDDALVEMMYQKKMDGNNATWEYSLRYFNWLEVHEIKLEYNILE